MSSLSASAIGLPTQSLAWLLALHGPLPMTASCAARRSLTVTASSGLGHSHRSTTPTLSPLAKGTLTNLNHDVASGGARLLLPLSTRKYPRLSSTPAFLASSAVMLLRTRAERAALSSALAPRPSSTVVSPPFVFLVW